MINPVIKGRVDSGLTTLPGVLTGIAALVGAITALITVLNQLGLIGGKPTISPSPISSSLPSLSPTLAPTPIVTSTSSPTTSSSGDPYKGPTIQKVVDGNVTWELKSCLRELSNVHCIFSISTSQEQSYGIRVGSTKMQVSGGDEYFASLVQSGNRQSSAGGNDGIHIDMAHNEPYKVIIDFSGVSASVSRITFLDICVKECLISVKNERYFH